MTFVYRMMPGCEPYTAAEIELVHELVGDAAAAQDLVVDIDELERLGERMAFGTHQVDP